MLLKKLQISISQINSAVDSLLGIVRTKIALNAENEYRIRLVANELLTNILSYSDANDILLSVSLENGLLTITIEDNGQGFVYNDIIERDASEGEYLMSESGRGVFLVKMMSDGLTFNEKGNLVKVMLRLT